MDANVYRTAEKYNLHLVDDSNCDHHGMPVIHGTDYIPDKLIPFSKALTSHDYENGIHFFIDDYRFERVWNQPERYIPLLHRFDCVLTPDFSTYTDMPLPMQRWNVYRNRALGNLWQRSGIEVIPCISWGGVESFDFCFDGLPEGSVYAVSTIGCTKQKASIEGFKIGMDEAIRRLKPSKLIVYGKAFSGYDFSDIDCVFIHHNTMEGLHGR